VVTDHQGRQDVAIRYLEEAQALCQREGDVDQMLPILNALGNSYVDKAEFEKASACFTEAITLAEAMGNSLRVAVLQSNMGIIANRQKNYAEAIRLWRLAQQGFRVHKYDIGLANTTFNIAMALYGLEQYDEALAQIQTAYDLLEKLGQRRGMAGGLGVMGMIAHKLGDRSAARRYLHDGMVMAQETGSEGLTISNLAELAELELSGGNLNEALFLFLFIAQHPATNGTTRENAERMLADLTAELPPEMIAEAETAVQSHTLDSLIAQLVNQ
jgi:tetratricopeptide (TPR) repeat protein